MHECVEIAMKNVTIIGDGLCCVVFFHDLLCWEGFVISYEGVTQR